MKIMNFWLSFDRSFSKGMVHQITWLLGIMLTVYLILAGISNIGGLYTSRGGNDNRLIDILFVLIDPGSSSEAMSSPLTLICAVLGLAIFSGMLISVISNVLNRRVESYLKGETDYNVSNHVVVLGFNKSIPSLLQLIHVNHKNSMTILMSNRKSEEIRDWIHSNVSKNIEKKLIVINGDRLANEDIERLSLNKNVREIYLLGEENEVAHDAINMECVKMMASHIDKNSKVDCHVQIESHAMFSVLQSVDINKKTLKDGSTIGEHLNFIPFNFNEIWSQKVLATIPNKIFFPLDGIKGIQHDSHQHVHLIIVGLNEMGTSLAVNAAHLLHFPNYKEGDFSTYSQITFIDNEAAHKGRAFRTKYRNLFNLTRWRAVDSKDRISIEDGWIDPFADHNLKSPYRHLGATNFMDIQWEFIQGDIFDDAVQDYLSDCSMHIGEITTIALCDDDSEKNAAFCLALPELICKNANTILIRQKERPVTIELLQKLPGHEKILPFGMMTECYRESLISDKYGKIINACYNDIDIDELLTDRKAETEKIIEEAWEKCSILDKWSSNYCSNMLMTKLRNIGLDTNRLLTKNEIETAVNSHQEEIQRTEHNRWNTEKLLLGFSPLQKEEQDEFRILIDNWGALKDKKKKWSKTRKKHLDICSNDMLKEVDPPVVGNDNRVNSKLWALYNMINSNNIY